MSREELTDRENLILWCQTVLERLKPIYEPDIPLPMSETVTLKLSQDDYLMLLGLARWAEHEISLSKEPTNA